MRHMQLTIRLLRETDGRWIVGISELPGVTVYGATSEEATLKAKALALRVIAEEIEHGEMPPGADTLQFSVADRLFRKVLELQPDAETKSWSLLYLARLADSQGDRDQAVENYKAALAVPDAPESVRQAAQKGVAEAFKK